MKKSGGLWFKRSTWRMWGINSMRRVQRVSAVTSDRHWWLNFHVVCAATSRILVPDGRDGGFNEEALAGGIDNGVSPHDAALAPGEGVPLQQQTPANSTRHARQTRVSTAAVITSHWDSLAGFLPRHRKIHSEGPFWWLCCPSHMKGVPVDWNVQRIVTSLNTVSSALISRRQCGRNNTIDWEAPLR